MPSRPPTVAGSIPADPADVASAQAAPPTATRARRRLRTGDEQAFVRSPRAITRRCCARGLVRLEHGSRRRGRSRHLAGGRARDRRFRRALLVQDVAVQILVNRARSTGVREQRSIAIGDAAPAVDSSRFDASGAWMLAAAALDRGQRGPLLAEALAGDCRALESLPARQRES